MTSTQDMSLKDRSLVNISILLCSSTPKTMKRLTEIRRNDESNMFDSNPILLEVIIFDKIDEIECLPDILKDAVKSVAGYTVTEIRRFYNYLKKITHDEKFLMSALDKLCWTQKGILDCKSTALKIISNKKFDKVTRYKLACLFCFKNKVLNLWNKMSTEEQSDLVKMATARRRLYHSVIGVWTLQIANQKEALRRAAQRYRLDYLIDYKFLCAIQDASPEAVKYYWHKIPQWRRHNIVLKSIHSLEDIRRYLRCDILEELNSCQIPYLANVIVFLFWNSEAPGFEPLFRICPDYANMVMQCLMEWPFRENLLAAYERLLPLVGERGHTTLSEELAMRVAHTSPYDDFYLDSLMDMWKSSSGEKRSLLREYIHAALRCLIVQERNDRVVIFYKKFFAQTELQRDFMFCHETINTCKELENMPRYDLLKFFIELILSLLSVEQFLNLYFPINLHRSILAHVRNFSRSEIPAQISEMLKKAPKVNFYTKETGWPGQKSVSEVRSATPDMICVCCQGDSVENKATGIPEGLLSCSNCTRSVHPSCIMFTTQFLISAVQTYRWECALCKTCSICHRFGNQECLYYCKYCDRAFHVYCLTSSSLIDCTGVWSCCYCNEEWYSIMGIHY